MSNVGVESPSGCGALGGRGGQVREIRISCPLLWGWFLTVRHWFRPVFYQSLSDCPNFLWWILVYRTCISLLIMVRGPATARCNSPSARRTSLDLTSTAACSTGMPHGHGDVRCAFLQYFAWSIRVHCHMYAHSQAWACKVGAKLGYLW